MSELIVALFGMFWLFIMAIWGLAVLLYLVDLILTIVMIVDCSKRETFRTITGENAKVIWIIILLALFFIFPIPLLGPILYYFLEKRKDSKKQVGGVPPQPKKVEPAS